MGMGRGIHKTIKSPRQLVSLEIINFLTLKIILLIVLD